MVIGLVKAGNTVGLAIEILLVSVIVALGSPSALALSMAVRNVASFEAV
jgi:hypothetical protein